MTALQQAWELESANHRYGYVYGIALNSTGKSKEAIGVMENILKHHSNNPQILMALTMFHRDQGNQKSALQYAKRLGAASPQNPTVQQLLQEILGKRKN